MSGSVTTAPSGNSAIRLANASVLIWSMLRATHAVSGGDIKRMSSSRVATPVLVIAR
jgi:hypothetical protein